MKFECYFCGKTFECTELVDIEDEQKHKYHVCMNCYIKGIDVILEGQYNELISQKNKKSGHWIEPDSGTIGKYRDDGCVAYYTCSCCKETSKSDYDFCPSCGARMDGGADNG